VILNRTGLVVAACGLLAGCVATVIPQPMVVLVAGGSGRTGGFVIEQLRSEGYSVRPLTQNRARAVERFGEDWDWREVDVRDGARVLQAMVEVDYVVSVLGAGARSGPNSFEFVDFGGVRNLVDAAAQRGVKHFVLISSAAAGPHQQRSTMIEAGNVRYWKTRGENHLKRSGLNYTIIGPGGLENEPSTGAGLRALSRSDYRTGLVARGDVARVAVASLKEPAAASKSFALIRDKTLAADSWRALLNDIAADTETKELPPPE